MKKEKSEHKNYIDMEVYLADIKRYRETIETQKMLLDKLMEENKKLKEALKELRERYNLLKKRVPALDDNEPDLYEDVEGDLC